MTAAKIRDINTEIVKLRYTRAQTRLLVSPAEQASTDELAAYFNVCNHLTGTNYSVESIKNAQMQRRFDLYERVTGYKIGSPEMNAAVDVMVDAMKHEGR